MQEVESCLFIYIMQAVESYLLNRYARSGILPEILPVYLNRYARSGILPVYLNRYARSGILPVIFK